MDDPIIELTLYGRGNELPEIAPSELLPFVNGISALFNQGVPSEQQGKLVFAGSPETRCLRFFFRAILLNPQRADKPEVVQMKINNRLIVLGLALQVLLDGRDRGDAHKELKSLQAQSPEWHLDVPAEILGSAEQMQQLQQFMKTSRDSGVEKVTLKITPGRKESVVWERSERRSPDLVAKRGGSKLADQVITQMRSLTDGPDLVIDGVQMKSWLALVDQEYLVIVAMRRPAGDPVVQLNKMTGDRMKLMTVVGEVPVEYESATAIYRLTGVMGVAD